MDRRYGLSPTEYELMEYFWQQDAPKQFGEVLAWFNERKEKNWKKQTLNTYLNFLREADLLAINEEKPRKRYYAAVSREEHLHAWIRTVCREAFGSSVVKLLDAYLGGGKFEKKTAKELKEYIKKHS